MQEAGTIDASFNQTPLQLNYQIFEKLNIVWVVS
jgi:hypothetical protein